MSPVRDILGGQGGIIRGWCSVETQVFYLV